MTLVDALQDEARTPSLLATDLDLGTRRSGLVVAAVAQMPLPGIAVISITGRPDAARGRMPGEREVLMHKPFLPGALVGTARWLMRDPAHQPSRRHRHPGITGPKAG